MNCANHEQTPAVAACTSCGRRLCQPCAILVQGRVTCKECLERKSLQLSTPGRLHKSAGLAAVLSLMPGLGQVYVGYYFAGFVNMLIFAGVITLLESHRSRGMEPFLGVFLGFFIVFNIIDAVRKAQLYNRKMDGGEAEKLPTDSPLFAGILLLIFGAIFTLDVTLGIDVDFIAEIWPLGLLVGGVYLIWKYARTRRELAAARCGGNASELAPTSMRRDPDA